MSGAAERLIIAETIKQFPGTGDIPHPEFNTLVNLLYESLKHIGHKRIEKQILIYPSEESIKQYNGISICPEYYCDIILNQRGVNVVIARFNKDNVFLAKSLQIRVGELKPKIVNVLKEKYYLDLKELLGQFKLNNIFLVDQYLTKTASIVRHKTFCSVACTYFATTKSYQREKYELPFLDYFVYNNGRDRGWFEDNTCYAIYFFL
ncbi:unnamed protein product [Meloidogyne enterolobii]|uniref:Uncharacterized protein n=1 Tax=Meloidogyne enterolobii TaxID=390850 RepID=A0ACB0YHZ1_MELEN